VQLEGMERGERLFEQHQRLSRGGGGGGGGAGTRASARGW
jgi:hypothetical protein